MLEKSRIIMQGPEERAYHIFYYLLNSASDEIRQKFKISEIEDFPYINLDYSDSGKFDEIDEEEYRLMQESMEGLNFTAEEKNAILSIVGSICHISNIEIEEGRENDSSNIAEGDRSAENAAELLGIGREGLEELVCSKQFYDILEKKNIKQMIPVEKAFHNRESLAKFLYSKMFDWIVDRVNVSIRKKFVGSRKQYKSIGEWFYAFGEEGVDLGIRREF